jgi:hypothetical protein
VQNAALINARRGLEVQKPANENRGENLEIFDERWLG